MSFETVAAPASGLHHPSHRSLLRDDVLPVGLGRVDAVIVPATRTPSYLMPSALLAKELGCPFVVICSHDAHPEAIRDATSKWGVDVYTVDLRSVTAHPLLATTSVLQGTPFHKRANTPVKRNLGLMIARMTGWEKVIFLDDDVTGVQAEAVRRAARLLDGCDVVGLTNVGFPDNSVVCHANRDTGGDQSTFIGGGAMLCATTSVTSLFPDIYNEDWLFLVDRRGILDCAVYGEFAQIEFDPYQRPSRAASEEFGDCLGEGLYTLLDHGLTPRAADQRYWRRFLPEREKFIDDILGRLPGAEMTEPVRKRVRASLRTARESLGHITPELCTGFLTAWERDQRLWQRVMWRLPTGLSLDEALAHLYRPG